MNFFFLFFLLFFLQIVQFGECCLPACLFLCFVYKQNIIHFYVSSRLDKSRWQSMVNSVRPFVLLFWGLKYNGNKVEYITVQLPCCDSVAPYYSASAPVCLSIASPWDDNANHVKAPLQNKKIISRGGKIDQACLKNRNSLKALVLVRLLNLHAGPVFLTMAYL